MAMANTNLITEPLTLGQTAIPARSTRKVAVLCLLGGLALAAVLVGSGQVLEKAGTTMLFSSPLAVRPRPFLAAAPHRPQVTANAISRAKKEQIIADLTPEMADASLVVVANWGAITVPEKQSMANQIKEAGGTYRVVKNTLFHRVINGTKDEELYQYLYGGPSAVIYSKDNPVEVAKVLVKVEKAFKKEDETKFSLQGGTLEGKLLDAAGLKSLSSMPSLDESRAQIAGLLNQPAKRIASIPKGIQSKLARAIKMALVDEKEESA